LRYCANIIVGCWLLVAGCWLLVAGCWLLVAENIEFIYNPESVTSKSQPPVSPEFLQYFPETT
jgi:hypothetical protein